MTAKRAKKDEQATTEVKIKNAARVVFHKKGYAATRTRDIAEEAGINLALLNYYFRSKEKLFDIIMMETMQEFFQSMTLVFNDDSTSLETKVETIAERYIDLLLSEPDIPIFLLNELRNNPTEISQKLNMKQAVMGSIFFKQWQQAVKENKTQIQPLHFIVNLMSLVVFPFVGSPILKMLGDMKQEQFNKMMLERKKLIPTWIKAMKEAG
jgi:AcrR family transcriptional regulator